MPELVSPNEGCQAHRSSPKNCRCPKSTNLSNIVNIFVFFKKMLVYQQYRIRTSLHDLGLEYFSSRRWEQDKPRVNPKNFYLSSWTGWLTENADLIVHLFLLKRSMPGPSKLLLDGEPITETLTNKNIAGKWLWRSWQSGRLRYQRTRVRIQ